MLDMSPMRGVWVDPTTRTRPRPGGLPLGDVDRETQLHGLAAVLGFISNTGIAGLTLGGGFGYLTRRLRLDVGQSSISLEVVTADGRIVRASEKENSGSVLGPARRRRQLRRRDRLRLPAPPGRSGDDGGAIAWRAEAAGRCSKCSVPSGAGPARARLRRRAPHRAACALAGEGRARQADRRALCLPHRAVRRRREARRADQGLRLAGRRHDPAPPVRRAAKPARRDAAEGPALLLEVRVLA